MTDRDQSLQEAFDRHLRGDGPVPDTQGDPEAAAYQRVYAALREEPDGDLPNNFAEQVANRVGLSSEPVVSVAELLLLLVALAGFGAAVVTNPSLLAALLEGVDALSRTVQQVSVSVRLDVLFATGFVLVLTVLFDRFLSQWHLAPRAVST